jgi:hypothetical protein
LKYAFALSQTGCPPPIARQCTVAELDILIAGIDQANEEAERRR